MAPHRAEILDGGAARGQPVEMAVAQHVGDLLGADRERHFAARCRRARHQVGADGRLDRQQPFVRADHAAEEQVVALHEARDESRRRPPQDLLGRPLLLDPRMVHDHDQVAQREGLVLVVRDPDEGDAGALLQRLQLQHHRLAQRIVEGADRLVEQQEPRLGDHGAGQRHALALATRQTPGLAVGERRDLEGLQHLRDALGDLDLGLLQHLEAKAHLPGDGHVREQREVLEHHGDVALPRRIPGRLLAADQDAAVVGLLEAGDAAQRRGLAAARGAEQADELSLLDLERDAVDGGEVAVALPDAAQLEIELRPCHHLERMSQVSGQGIHVTPPRRGCGGCASEAGCAGRTVRRRSRSRRRSA